MRTQYNQINITVNDSLLFEFNEYLDSHPEVNKTKLLRSLIRSFLSDSHNPPTSPQKTTVLTLEILHEAILNIDERLTALENF